MEEEGTATVTGGGGGGEGGGGGGSEGEKKLPEGELKVKRKMKTASQLEILENTYAVETYPSETIRAELSEKLGLSDRQLQMWFCHRRLKDRKTPPVKRQRKDVSSPAKDEIVGNEHASGSGSGSGLFPNTEQRRTGVALARVSPTMKRYYEPPQAISELRAIAFVEAQLGEPLREDGPILGMEFDPLPPGAFGAPIAPVGQVKSVARSYDVAPYEHPVPKIVKGPPRMVHEYQFLPEQPSIKTEAYERAVPSHYFGSPVDSKPNDRPFLHGSEPPIPSLSLVPHQHDTNRLPISASGEYVGIDPNLLLERRAVHDEEIARNERKRKSEEARLAKEVEANEKKIRKELEKQDILRRKREEQTRKEMERLDRERRKEEERLLREKQREEERYQREQKREMERREKFLQKESLRAEKLKLREEMRREKEAARLKAATDRATARRMAKESIELIEDERLELLELAALSRGLPSILSLDSETLENIELLRDKLPAFPPKSEHMKRPFAIQPWIDSEENVGNLLMVWRFLITFADVLGLWPFTLDEFVQAFHDYDSRLLGEIHIALLRSIIKDIQDVARTPSNGLGANQNTAANSSGGHPDIVEGAYSWGFDIRIWQHHLNPLTWPEILRQFALSAGLGPKLKKRNVEPAYHRDENEVNNGESIISKLRNGTAAENAFAKMQERGFGNPKRSRHRLTPGTVKFAAFHVLSLEGSKGLSILGVADRIQKSGLRDLTTSKTPEASIAAALSRDTKLFERTAPSTYCVRSPYRKDSIDADSILSAAREKIQVFKNGYFDGEEADDVEADDVERDEDSESDADELVTTEPKSVTIKEAEPISHSSIKTPETDVICQNNNNVISLEEEDTFVDESNLGETWVHGLTEAEYSDLSVLERLNALVSLISVANEGNSIRVVLEERLEAANSLKKQLWAEAQVDKRRIKEEYVAKIQYSSLSTSKVDQNDLDDPPLLLLQQEQHPNDIPIINNFTNTSNPMILSTDGTDSIITLHQTGYAAEKSRWQLKAYIGHKAEEMYVYRSLPLGQDRRRNRYWRFVTSASHNDPGSGRLYIELRDGSWRVIDSEEGFDSLLACLDIRGLRESHLHSMLLKFGGSFRESIRRKKIKGDVSFGSNVTRYQEFEKWMWEECTDPLLLRATKNTENKQKQQQLLKVCGECMELYLLEDNHCPSCHTTFASSTIEEDKFTEHAIKCKDESKGVKLHELKSVPSLKNVLLKALLASIEMSVPAEALRSGWSGDFRKLWCMKLLSISSTEDILKILTLVEGAIRRDSLSSSYETTAELIGCGYVPESDDDILSGLERISVLPWIPKTTSAVALRLMELDASISYVPGRQPMDSFNTAVSTLFGETYKMFSNWPIYMNDIYTFFFCLLIFFLSTQAQALPSSKFSVVKNIPDDNLTHTPHEVDNLLLDSWVDSSADPTIQGRGRGRGRGGRTTRGGRSQRKSISSSGRKSGTSGNTDGFGQLSGWKGKAARGRGGHKRGRRTARTRQKTKPRVVVAKTSVGLNKQQIPPSVSQWIEEETVRVEPKHSPTSSSSESSDYDDYNNDGQATGDEYDDMITNDYVGINGKPERLAGGRLSYDNIDQRVEGEEFDNEDIDSDDDDDAQGDMDVENYINDESDNEMNRDEFRNQTDNMDEIEENSASSTSGYSD
ncbi:homeobox-DDT domain protein RLT2 [Impatiens glandulifera]|uniref:homeobox-DDT domain protein RLT2 n=1 Tax=Impatiens glandulifera TaxID=253017 RepID=UPI001FB0EC95|nr:homeobox-DDT domain protein RLT2 [Impatiens glandulifera]